MTNGPLSNWIQVHLDTNRFSVQPGKAVSIPVDLLNAGEGVDHLEFSVRGLPPDWLGAPLPIVMLPPGETRQVALVLQPPAYPRVQAGQYPFLLRIVSLRLPARSLEVDLILTVAAVFSPPPVAAFLALSQFSLRPGYSLTFPLVIANLGLQADEFQLAFQGIPTEWVSADRSRATLRPGEQAEINLTLSPPHEPQSRAGTHAFTLRISGMRDPSLSAVLPCSLSLQTYHAFTLNLLNDAIPLGSSGLVQVENRGNTEDVYTLCFHSMQEKLEFQVTTSLVDAGKEHEASAGKAHVSPWGVAVPEGRVRIKGDNAGAYKGLLLHIPWGQKLDVEFTPKSLKPPILQSVWEPFSIEVESARRERQEVQGVAEVPPAAYTRLTQVIVALFLASFAIAFVLLGAFILTIELPAIPATFTASPTATGPTPTPRATATATFTMVLTSTTTLTPTPPTLTITPTQSATPTITRTGTLLPTHTSTSPPLTATPTRPQFSSPTPTLPVFPLQDLGRIAFETSIGGSPNIFGYDLFKRQVLVYYQSAGIDTQPAWSPDGKRLAFASNQSGQYEIYVINLETNELIQLTNNPAEDQFPSWSPDGNQIAFTTNRDGNQEIYVASLDGSTPRNLTQNPANDFQPDWFVEQRILFTSDRDNNQEVYLMNSDGSSQTNLTRSPGNDFEPAGAHDLSSVAFTTDRDGNREIYLMDLDGSRQTNLTQYPAQDEAPTWSADFRWIAFSSNRDGNWDIYAIRRDRSGLYHVISFDTDEKYPAWIYP